MAVDTKLNTAAPHQATPPSASKQTDGIPSKEAIVGGTISLQSIQPPAEGKKPSGGTDKTKMAPSPSDEEISNKEKKETTRNTKLKNDETIPKLEKSKAPVSKNNNFNRVNQTRNRVTPINKSYENVNNSKVKKDTGNDVTESSVKANCKDTLAEIKKTVPKTKQFSQEEDLLSEASSTEYVTFDAYVDMMENGKTHERKLCFNKSDDNVTLSTCKPSSSSSSLSSISTIVESPSSNLQDTAFDAKNFRTSLLEASEIPYLHDFIQSTLSKDKDYLENICAWTPHLLLSIPSQQSLDNKLNGAKSIPKHRQQYLQQQQQNVGNSNSPPKFQRSLTMAPSREDIYSMPVYERLMSLGRYQEFVFQHRPDDWRWYMKAYTAVHTVGRVGTKKKKKSVKFGVDVPDPYAMMGKRVASSSTFDPKNHPSTHSDSERQSKKHVSREDNSFTDETSVKRDRSYPVLAQTREANPAKGNSNKNKRSEKVTKKSSKSDIQKSDPDRPAHAQAIKQPQGHQPHPFLPNLSSEDVRLNLISTKILHRNESINNDTKDINTNDDVTNKEEEDNDDDHDCDDDNKTREHLWLNPFQSVDDFEQDSLTPQQTFHEPPGTTSTEQSDKTTKTSLQRSTERKELSVIDEPKQNPPQVSENKRKTTNDIDISNTNNISSGSNPAPQHMKAELGRDPDGTLVVKISVYNNGKSAVKGTSSSSSSKTNMETAEDNKGGKGVQICREETKLFGEELHAKLIDLNNKELGNSKDIGAIDKHGKVDLNETDTKRTSSKDSRHNQIEKDTDQIVKKNGREKQNTENVLSLQGEKCNKKKKSKSLSKEKTDLERLLALDSIGQYPKQRSAYQEIDFANHNKPKAKPTIKYTKSKDDDENAPETNNVKQNKNSLSNDTRQNKGRVYQTVSIRSSTVHLATEVNSEDGTTSDVLTGRSVHQSYPVTEWKKTVDEGKCGFIVKSFPKEKNSPRKNVKSEQDIKNANGKTRTQIESSSLKPNRSDDRVFLESGECVDDNNNQIGECLQQKSMHVENLIDQFSPTFPSEEFSNASKTVLRKGRLLYRLKPDKPSIKISTDDPNNVTFVDEVPVSSVSCLFPPLHQAEHNKVEKNNTAQDDLFISGVSHDRTKSRDTGYVSRKRPVSLDRGMIDDLVRYHTETSSVGFKNQSYLHGHSQGNLVLQHHHSPHHHSFIHNHHHHHPFKQQPEESPSLMPSVQKLEKGNNFNLRPNPTSPGDDRKLGSISDKELNHKRQIEIYTRAKKNSNVYPEKNSSKISDLHTVLGLTRLP